MWMIANWKAGISQSQQALELFYAIAKGCERFDRIKTVIAAPFVYLPLLSAARGKDLRPALASQTVSFLQSGAHTGEISAAMLANLCCGYAIVGHSERRSLLNEDDTRIAAQLKQLFLADIQPILCVGENKDQRAKGIQEEVVAQQLESVLKLLENEAKKNDNSHVRSGLSKMLIAYEPVWAIGAKLCDCHEATQMHNHIAEVGKAHGYDWPVLYGGGVNPDTWPDMLSNERLGGSLIGGSSLNGNAFLRLIEQSQDYLERRSTD